VKTIFLNYKRFDFLCILCIQFASWTLIFFIIRQQHEILNFSVSNRDLIGNNRNLNRAHFFIVLVFIIHKNLKKNFIYLYKEALTSFYHRNWIVLYLFFTIYLKFSQSKYR